MNRIAVALIAGLFGWTASAQEVDVALVLAADASQSVSAEEQKIQRVGYARALVSTEVQLAIATSGRNKRIAVSYFEWGSEGLQVLVVPWTIIDGPRAAAEVARKIEAAPSNALERTAIGSALVYADALLKSAPAARRSVVDVSGDGVNNQGASVTEARDALVARGVTINGLPIIDYNDSPGADLLKYYDECVIGGEGAFVVAATGIENFERALKIKLVMEIAGIDPGAVIVPAAYTPFNCN